MRNQEGDEASLIPDGRAIYLGVIVSLALTSADLSDQAQAVLN